MPATYEPIATTTLGSNSTSYTFTSIGSSYTDLRLVITGNNGGSTGLVRLRFNSDTATNYSFTNMSGDGTTASSGGGTTQNGMQIGSLYSGTKPSVIIADIFSYRGSTNKTILASCAADQNGSGITYSATGMWRNTAAITSVTALATVGSLGTGTTLTLYGILKA